MKKHMKEKTRKQQSSRVEEILCCSFLLGTRTQSIAWNKKNRERKKGKEKKPLNEWVFFSIVVYDHNLAMHLLATVIIKQALTINKKTMKMKAAKWK